MEVALFAALGLVAILAALLTVSSPSPVASALYLVLSLFAVAGLYVLLAAPFVAAIQVIVYAGAVVVLILFVIMLLNLMPIREQIPSGWKAAGVAVSLLILVTTFLSVMSAASLIPQTHFLPVGFGKVRDIAQLLFSRYLYAFEVVSVLLLLAVIGAVSLIRKPETRDADAN